MPNKNYIKGRKIEYEAMRELESDGYIAIRTAGSHSPFDVIGIGKPNISEGKASVRLIQIKSTKSTYNPDKETKKLMKIRDKAELNGLFKRTILKGQKMVEKVVAVVTLELWVRKDGRKGFDKEIM